MGTLRHAPEELSQTFGGLADAAAEKTATVTHGPRGATMAKFHIQVTTDTPTAAGVVEVYLIQGHSDTFVEDSAADAAGTWTPNSATLLGTIPTTSAAATVYRQFFDSTVVTSCLSEKFAIGIVNRTTDALRNTAGDCAVWVEAYVTD